MSVDRLSTVLHRFPDPSRDFKRVLDPLGSARITHKNGILSPRSLKPKERSAKQIRQAIELSEQLTALQRCDYNYFFNLCNRYANRYYSYRSLAVAVNH
ncbi:hypothetical protein AVEN_144223-1 [Araneus ventricosus]|uniref:Uncharacterized protein n=1 Tax=Araneus ventricosus TaxID=182803 RepID=A0A4Y2T8Z9_ARAVE|nr:hypothetical protein AVEN_144223-1 [Araneus ventricosus]